MATTWTQSQSHSSRLRRTLEDLLEGCGVQINGNNSWDIRVFNEDFYARVLHQGSLGFGESYMERWWDVGDLEELIYRILKARLDERVRTWRDVLSFLSAALVNRQRRSRAFVVGERHYDIGNDLYERMLDSRMIYSCGYWENANTLEEAQRAKLDLVFRKLALQPGQRVLDVGCGWEARSSTPRENTESRASASPSRASRPTMRAGAAPACPSKFGSKTIAKRAATSTISIP